MLFFLSFCAFISLTILCMSWHCSSLQRLDTDCYTPYSYGLLPRNHHSTPPRACQSVLPLTLKLHAPIDVRRSSLGRTQLIRVRYWSQYQRWRLPQRPGRAWRGRGAGDYETRACKVSDSIWSVCGSVLDVYIAALTGLGWLGRTAFSQRTVLTHQVFLNDLICCLTLLISREGMPLDSKAVTRL